MTEKQEKVKRLAERGYKLEEIGQMTGVKKSAVCRILKRINFHLVKHKKFTMSNEQIDNLTNQDIRNKW